ncbi:NAD(P)-dependent dehydrogenase (short-subunit alcohol dehydrogenase family) [Arcanobacterium wilhelmae]|uniref:NAD(P)-dependent dehydrogenase (Short-subunit alcohol dehydrogenase family) n=1 Tax=Arcanobacterium wilhelmae TaxID=1803177 RepID=A0ABT9NBY5_9ACTO|nr:SDR family oxidoreductase [Arcanobacterium wilhelmae]MDP9801000.1 NAD(P)-dependent dehydrogenase (short-subunit alcohol dehydrogenase family) [Arcanobacterium wilhelmae]WFN90360.1 SDR family oxidoreductase [Arcanobacterium wilhelmae]
MDLHLTDKVFIVTGAFKGIGKGIALQLAREGAVVVAISRDSKGTSLPAYVEEISAITDRHAEYVFDLGETEKIGPTIDEVYATYGRIDGIVNNAGVNDNKDLESTSWQDFEASLHYNLTHYYETVHAAVGYLKESKGAVLNIGSKTALTGQGKTSAYAAAKGAILGLTREWAAALVKDEVRVNAIVVAESWTPLYADWIKTFGDKEAQDARLKVITDKIPLGHRMTSTEEIADTAVFLLSDRSSHTTGQWVNVDGGYINLDRALD